MKRFRCFLLMRFPPATPRSENSRLLIVGSGFCMISPALCCGVLDRARQSVRFQPLVELFDPVIAGCALLAHTPTMMAVFIDVKFGFVSLSFEGIVESDDWGPAVRSDLRNRRASPIRWPTASHPDALSRGPESRRPSHRDGNRRSNPCSDRNAAKPASRHHSDRRSWRS